MSDTSEALSSEEEEDDNGIEIKDYYSYEMKIESVDVRITTNWGKRISEDVEEYRKKQKTRNDEFYPRSRVGDIPIIDYPKTIAARLSIYKSLFIRRQYGKNKFSLCYHDGAEIQKIDESEFVFEHFKTFEEAQKVYEWLNNRIFNPERHHLFLLMLAKRKLTKEILLQIKSFLI